MTTVYVALINDRHSDPDNEVFTTAEAAITYAKNCAVECSLDGTYDERQIADWLFYATYSPEGDCVRVQAKEVRE